MHGYEKQRHVHRVAADPGHWLVVIRGGDTEHAAIKCAPASRASGVVVRFCETLAPLPTPGGCV